MVEITNANCGQRVPSQPGMRLPKSIPLTGIDIIKSALLVLRTTVSLCQFHRLVSLQRHLLSTDGNTSQRRLTAMHNHAMASLSTNSQVNFACYSPKNWELRYPWFVRNKK